MTAPVDQQAFREAMARFASGVTVVTTGATDGSLAGFTASAFSSLSLDPPLLLVCLQKDADCYGAFMQAERFAVSILSQGQAAIALRFATKSIDKLDGTPTIPAPLTRLPVVQGASAWAECTIHERVDAGDHTILIGRVIGADATDTPPLLHFNRRFGQFAAGDTP